MSISALSQNTFNDLTKFFKVEAVICSVQLAVFGIAKTLLFDLLPNQHFPSFFEQNYYILLLCLWLHFQIE
jgi:hypothetical protein